MHRRETAELGGVGRKIDFLMNVTNMHNAQLARALNFDASYVSRIRAGKRGLPAKLPFIEPAAEFFARNVREGYQADTLARETGVMGGWPADKGKAARLIARWLRRETGGSDRGAGDAVADEVDGARRSSRHHPLPRRGRPLQDVRVQEASFFCLENKKSLCATSARAAGRSVRGHTSRTATACAAFLQGCRCRRRARMRRLPCSTNQWRPLCLYPVQFRWRS